MSYRTLTRPPAATPPLYSQDGEGYRATVHAHYFIGGCDWLITEYDPDSQIAFGWACLGDRQNAELGYVSIAELEAVGPIIGQSVGLVDYDEHWSPVPLTEAIAALDKRSGR